jgi:hypothetical protein
MDERRPAHAKEHGEVEGRCRSHRQIAEANDYSYGCQGGITRCFAVDAIAGCQCWRAALATRHLTLKLYF